MLYSILKTMRPRQWIKNAFVLAPLIFDRQLGNPSALLRTIAGLVLFSLISGVVYIINDIADIESDRQHPQKKNRPIASGKLSIHTARIAAILLLAIIIPAAFLLSWKFALAALGYFLLIYSYSRWLKHVPLIDVLVIAAGFVIRVVAGVVLIVVERFSPWLFVCTTLLALFIGFGKRRAELALLAKDASNHRKVLDGYTIPLLDQLITIVSSTTLMAYSLYTFSAVNLPENHLMMLTIPFVLYGIFRYIYLVQVNDAGGAPEDVILSDRALQMDILLWGLSVVAIIYLSK
ncbi:MAG TPA: decaprenyl-phosphate phosphoribosyltransferase [Anaerolineaceae bacterium]|nr:decaprenyl-phosphate phosphoribosyltransferase [Anaerolineaceae bacterium]HOH18806.1 decaprenyl-phosphate phosphoribosyltransferase [Anaerolineaceae bacterium]